MDLQMPVMDWEAMRLLKADEATRHILIIAISAEDRQDPARLREAGFCAYVGKPVRPQEVVRAVEFCLQNDEEGYPWVQLPGHDPGPLVGGG
jgi:CheY-like chemotaxis protein